MALLSPASSGFAQTATRREDFARDPGWDARNTRPDPARCTEKIQDFGFSPTSHAGGGAGEIGGRIARSLTPASYARALPACTLNDRLHASGRLAVTASDGGSGALFGWFNHASRGWRTPNSMVVRVDGERNAVRIFFEYGTQGWKTGGGQTFEGAYQTTTTPMIPADGRPHRWTFDYDPAGAGGDGEMVFTFDDRRYLAPLEKGHKADGATFDRFGLLNVQISGKGLSLWLDDLEINGRTEAFAADPGWEGRGNRARFRDCAVRPLHDFGWRDSRWAGGDPGEIGGLMWRIEAMRPQEAGYCGMPVGELSLREGLKARGRLCLKGASADSAILVGWFNPLTAIGAPPPNFVGILIEGPSAVGYYVRPAMRSADEHSLVVDRGPILRPDDRAHAWSIEYTPGSAKQPGRVVATLDDSPVLAQVDPGLLSGGAALTHFGFVSWHRGGHFIEIYFDDLEFTIRGRPGE
jgi:hypothetical protein